MPFSWKNLPPSTRRKWVWLGLGVLALLLRLPFGWFPELTEMIYSRGIFQAIRYLLDYSIGILPFPLIYLLVVLLLGIIGRYLWRRRKISTQYRSFGARMLAILHSMGAWAGGILFFFMLLWGFNYQRVPVHVQLAYGDLKADSSEVVRLARTNARLLEESRQALAGSKAEALPESQWTSESPRKVREALESVLEEEGYPTPGKLRVKPIWPPGALMRFGTAGIYIPFTGQGCYPSDMPAVDRPFTVAHEMAHGYGFGDEGTCNFWAWRACEASRDPFLQYSARLNFYSYLAREVNALDTLVYQEIRDGLSPGVQADRQVMRDWSAKYRSQLTSVGYSINNAYLKSQGVRAGIRSYNQWVLLAAAYRRSQVVGDAYP